MRASRWRFEFVRIKIRLVRRTSSIRSQLMRNLFDSVYKSRFVRCTRSGRSDGFFFVSVHACSRDRELKPLARDRPPTRPYKSCILRPIS
jgi:hypothetical protein